jgi:hypothetical protein
MGGTPMSVTNVLLDLQMSDDDRRARLCAGDIFIYSPTPKSRALTDLGRAMLEECLAATDPRTIHARLVCSLGF